ncbi:MAG: rRNA methyltransferase [Alphaproteobacteria bacterium]|nr:rRNA methyltransferase [Alphaproteobacteria bacterium]
MPIPRALAAAIADELQGLPSQTLKDAAARLSLSYRTQEAVLALGCDADRLAYCAARMPATYAAIETALAEVGDAFAAARSLLDVGAGPGTAAWAIADRLPGLAALTCLEAHAPWAALARRFAARSETSALRNAVWLTGDAATAPLPAADLVSATYLLNELPEAETGGIVKRLWNAAGLGLLLVEPGSRAGFARIAVARETLLAQGAAFVAPCTHHSACPMRPGDWCHFSVRLEREAFHRHAKAANLSYEDEKFSYLIAVKVKVPSPEGEARIIRRPMRASGRVTLDLCGKSGLARTTIPRSAGPAYRRAKMAQWGDLWRSRD